ncbi:hypothetical protein [Hymenobacter sp. YC55]|uniref:hypothetical protein n=1 Tax=Hymenobacter sp. YC55 TaxID=3034019 RepID=UPI0023F8FC44|nr:hypothetical protein [Hymenobacter sp. YC55]MDF7815227.1 hypothetical protein [Hymenobacter sp. YC55]
MGLRRKQTALLFTSHTYAAPTYWLRTLHVIGHPDWQAKGFQKTEKGGFVRASTVGTELRLEYAVAMSQQPGWLYLLASAPAPTPRQVQEDQLDPALSTRRRAMEEEFTQFIFPSIASGQPSPESK